MQGSSWVACEVQHWVQTLSEPVEAPVDFWGIVVQALTFAEPLFELWLQWLFLGNPWD